MLLLITLPFTTFVKSSNCDFVANVVPLVTDITLFEHATDVTALPEPVVVTGIFTYVAVNFITLSF